ncbi:conserved hypothetical protein [Ricinus communis]|uniref:Uncharacterized protein n=1 Tax=Ricinus communis TaxID=3988 RepID=B9T5K9_RICCO|nr:conserved hypothetical protein [Ricinus communis]
MKLVDLDKPMFRFPGGSFTSEDVPKSAKIASLQNGDRWNIATALDAHTDQVNKYVTANFKLTNDRIGWRFTSMVEPIDLPFLLLGNRLGIREAKLEIFKEAAFPGRGINLGFLGKLLLEIRF